MRPLRAPYAVERGCGLAAHAPLLGVHAMLVRIGDLDRKERPCPDMEGNAMERHATLLEAGNQRIREMQPCRGGCDRTFLLRKHSLIVDAVALIRTAPGGNIGRQRHLTPLVHRLVEHRPMKGKSERGLAALLLGLNRRIELAEEADLAFLPEPHHVAGNESLCRLDEGAPTRAVETLMQRRFDRGLRRAAPDPPAVQSGRDHFGVVDDERVPRTEEIRQIRHMTVRERGLRVRTNDQEAGGIARRDRTQGNALRG